MSYLSPEPQQVLDHVDVSAGRCRMQGGVAPLVPTGNIGTTRHQQLDNLQMPWMIEEESDFPFNVMILQISLQCASDHLVLTLAFQWSTGS